MDCSKHIPKFIKHYFKTHFPHKNISVTPIYISGKDLSTHTENVFYYGITHLDDTLSLNNNTLKPFLFKPFDLTKSNLFNSISPLIATSFEKQFQTYVTKGGLICQPNNQTSFKTFDPNTNETKTFNTFNFPVELDNGDNVIVQYYEEGNTYYLQGNIQNYSLYYDEIIYNENNIALELAASSQPNNRVYKLLQITLY